ncbi:tRNA 5-methylaminomethyl-2-thiouridine biosynthesis bifunctional protein MnmC [Kordia antarctica]|uniref:tRNA 5-methylaminomethyl-2-thiouridine biosynthesis bifunctional protein MnmC n=1 Tax=Kordia antarctica TaxID=1218801 RepID=A0A7L4ZRW6_9FLAO|nr:FAD-dependent oxidoreductase [Kordia antarctica]QHI39237.1 tRNA 5-methylaminomethyl-2-thiouridine biosynthesis bifunctional protein MnmC [Kordia antarctica]
MKRRDFFKKGTKAVIAAGIVPMVVTSCASSKDMIYDEAKDKWYHLGTGKTGTPNRKPVVNYEVAVIGGGAAGICAAVASARNGAKTVLIQDRSVLGGNASSEIRVHLNGVNNIKGKAERETGIIEEILLHNRFENEQESFPVFDHVLYDFVVREPNLTLMLNTQAVEAVMGGNKIKSARCWQSTTEKMFTINAPVFIDCSGDGLLAATAGAEYRTGREGKAEFNEKYAPDEPDGWQMGATLLMSSKDMGKPMKYSPPSYAVKYTHEGGHKRRKFAGFQDGIWWIEVGSNDDIIADAETNRYKLMAYLHGVWDFIKNSGKFPEAENLALDWVGSLPGRRESRRFMGDYIVSEKDMTHHKNFEDAVAFGGWSLDEHNPGGIENITEPPSYFHYHFKEVYQFPFRSLYSKNISNLLFAGRNVSQTHIALSSSRIMATCALQGQAVGTAASMCVKRNVLPREIGQKYINELQEQLLRDDVFIPKRPANDSNNLAKKASLLFASSTTSGDVKNLINGISRDIYGEINHWQSDGLLAEVQLEWENAISLSAIELKCDTNLKRNIMMRKDSRNDDLYGNGIPKEMLKALSFEARVNGQWKQVGEITDNRTRLIKVKLNTLKTTAIRIKMTETYGAKNIKLFEVRCYA